MKNFSLLLGVLIVIFACSTTDDKTAGANIEIPLDPAFLHPTNIAGTWVLPSATKTSTTSINISNTAGKDIFTPADMLLTSAKIGADFSVPLDQVVTFTLKALNNTPNKPWNLVVQGVLKQQSVYQEISHFVLNLISKSLQGLIHRYYTEIKQVILL